MPLRMSARTSLRAPIDAVMPGLSSTPASLASAVTPKGQPGGSLGRLLLPQVRDPALTLVCAVDRAGAGGLDPHQRRRPVLPAQARQPGLGRGLLRLGRWRGPARGRARGRARRHRLGAQRIKNLGTSGKRCKKQGQVSRNLSKFIKTVISQ